MIVPPAAVGVLGGGQLGRFFTLAAREAGYRALVFDPDPGSPAGAVADLHVRAAFEDEAAVREFASACAAVTVEFENVPPAAMEMVAAHCPTSPSPCALAIMRDRIEEKTFVRDCGLETAAFLPVRARADIAPALAQLPAPLLLKTAQLGYDGKGQAEVSSQAEAEAAFDRFGGVPCVLEEKVTLECELSVIVARARDGHSACYPVAQNTHRNGILHCSVAPAPVASALGRQATDAARALAETLDYQGVLGVEFFVARDGRLLVNEAAPRPHNSGHYTLDACAHSQFEQQLRVLCGLPLADTRARSAAVMINLLGDLWDAGAPDWRPALARADAKLHLYGKREARPGRKMGHFCLLGDDAERLAREGEAVFRALGGAQS